MTFSLRFLLVVVAIVACWLGALISQQAVIIELTSYATAFVAMLAIPIAFWDPRLERRLFCRGFLIFAVGTFLLGILLSAFDNLGILVAAIMRRSWENPPRYDPDTWEIRQSITYFASMLAGVAGGGLTLLIMRPTRSQE
jgi:hypothetical protein